MKNHWAIRMLGTALFLIIVPSYAIPPNASFVAKVVWEKGSFKAVNAQNVTRTLQKDSLVYLHDKLITDDKTQAQIVFTDNTLMTFKESTNFVISQYNFNAQIKKGSVGKYVMNLVSGGFRTITGLIAKSNSADYKVVTPVATMGVRGTDYAAYFGSGKLYMNYYHGTPFVQNAQGTFVLTAGQPYAYVPNATTIPTSIPNQPEVFKVRLVIVPVTLTGNQSSHNGGGGGGKFCSGTSSGFSLHY